MRAIFFLLLLCACVRVQADGPDAQGYRWVKDGKVGAPIVHRGVDVSLNCGIEQHAKSCAIIRGAFCDIYLPPDPEPWQEAHVRRHCAGWRHPDPLRNGFGNNARGEEKMSIKIKLSELMAAEPALQRVMQAKLPATPAYRMSRLVAKVASAANDFRKTQDKMVRDMGVEDPASPGRIEIKDPAKLKEFADQLQKLGEEEVVIDRDPIPISMFGEAQVSPADLAIIEAFVSGEGA